MEPIYSPETRTVKIPRTPGVAYFINDEPISGTVHIDEPVVIVAKPKPGSSFKDDVETIEWVVGDEGSVDDSKGDDQTETLTDPAPQATFNDPPSDAASNS